MIDYQCGKCCKPITDVSASIRPDGKLSIVLRCHGESHEFVVWYSMAGTLFGEPSVYVQRDRGLADLTVIQGEDIRLD